MREVRKVRGRELKLVDWRRPLRDRIGRAEIVDGDVEEARVLSCPTVQTDRAGRVRGIRRREDRLSIHVDLERWPDGFDGHTVVHADAIAPIVLAQTRVHPIDDPYEAPILALG